jgi:ABC-type polysaccharide/polyol phosphate transport system ATPase subunit
MGVPSIVVEGVGKRFELHQARSGSFKELLARKKRGAIQPEKDFWALEDISFTVEPGHPLAIIGHNGSGKSTLLKILTGILKPTRGKVDIRGRIGALIEVGAGFHPDLTGRENVYLNGSILGATRKEIDRHFDHIVAFAGLERFIDTPVKRYSSGMHMRLGFSIAAHLEPEILLIDEVLAVGDAQFQSRCIGHLKRFVAQGGSVVFVSHAMGHVEALCDRVLWLDHGRALGFGEAAPLIAQYDALVAEREDGEFQKLYPEEWAAREQEKQRQKERAERLAQLLEKRDTARMRRAAIRTNREAQRQQAEEAERALQAEDARSHKERRQAELVRLRAREIAWHEGETLRKQRALLDSPESFRIVGASLFHANGHATRALHVGEAARLEIRFRAGRALDSPVIGIDFFRISDGLHLFTVSNYDFETSLGKTPGEGVVALCIQAVTLGQGDYRVRLTTYPESRSSHWHLAPEDTVETALEFTVDAGRFANGCTWMPTNWSVR